MKMNKWFRRLLICTTMCLTMFNITIVVEGAHSDELKKDQEWSYSGKTGPEYWGSLDPSYVQCSNGLKQSPINISTSNVVKSLDQDQIKFHFKPTNFKVLNTGHSIEVVPGNQENILWINNEQYILKQFHFHHPSEHEINNEKFPMEIHLVHQNSNGQIAVVGLFVKEGLQNNVLKNVFKNVPKMPGLEEMVNNQTNLTDLFPKEKSFFTYEGSLTTPPCTEGVKWFILKEPIEMAETQISSFSELYPANYRPLQPINNRQVFLKSLK